MTRIFAILISLTVTFSAFAEGRIVLQSPSEDLDIELEGNLFYFIDTFSHYSFDNVLSSDFSNRFTQSDKSNFFYNTKAHTQWYKFYVDNQTNDYQELVLGINNPLVRRLTVFSSVDSVFYNTGILYPYNQRQVDYKNYLYEIRLKPNQSAVVCVRVEAQDFPLYVPFSLDYEENYDEKLGVWKFTNGLFYALIIIMLIVMIVLWSTEKDKTYVFFFILASIILLFNLWRDNVLFELFWPGLPKLNLIVGFIFYPLIYVSILLLANQIFKLVRINVHLKRLFKTTVFFSLGLTAFQFLIKDVFAIQIIYRLLAAALFVIIVWGVLASRKKAIQYYVSFAFVYFVLASYILLNVTFRFDARGFGLFDEHLSKIVLGIFFLVIGNIFIKKFRSSRTEVISLNKNLEQMVEKRTSQLNSQKEELKSQHEELILQKETLQTQREELRAQKELLELKNQELEKLSLVASKTDNLIYIFKPNGELDWFNLSFSHVMEMTYEEYKRSTPVSIVDISFNKNVRHVLNTCLREKTVVSYESFNENENGDTTWYHTTLTPILDKNNDVRLLIAIDTNITKLKQYEADLNDQRKDAESQKNLAIQRKEELEEQQIEVTDSIRYAKRIQTAIMPKIKQIQRDFQDSFVLFLPKDIVSGDFYWYHRIGDKYFIAAVDCTGHGVPGAFMSIIGNYLLNNIIIHNGVSDPAEILKQLNRKIKIAMKSDSRAQTADGMDISIAVIDKNEKTMAFAGALRPLYLFSKGDFIEAKGDKIPISSSIAGISLANFKTKYFDFEEGDTFYMFSDGIIDQFGGEKGKKFLTKRFKKILFDINDLPMRDQKEYVKQALDEWKGNGDQVDDILVMGVRF